MQIGTYLGIEAVPLFLLSQTPEISNIFVIGHFVVQKVWKAYKKNFRPIGWKKLWKLVYHNTSFGRITNKITTTTWHISSFHWGSKSNLNMSWVYMKQWGWNTGAVCENGIFKNSEENSKFKMIWWPVTGGSNLVALVSFTSELAFFIHILQDKKKLSPKFYQNLDIGSSD